MNEFLFIDISYELTIDTLEEESTLPCNSDMNFKLDDCLYEKMTKQLMKDFGCTIPYLPNLHNYPICNPDENGLAASKQYKEMKENGQRALCQKPCETTEVFSGMASFDHTEEDLAKMKIYLKTNTKVKKSVLDYSWLTMVAEIGGYTGLLLGISLVNVNSVLDKFFDRLIHK